MLSILRQSICSDFSFCIRKCTDEDIHMMNNWKKQDKFQPGLYDFQAFKMINNFKFWTGTLKNEPIAFFGSAQYDQNLAHLASFFVKKQYRGKGHGMKLWNHVLSQITAKNIGLNAVLKQQENYSKFGFKTSGMLTRYILTGRTKKYNSQNLMDCKEVDFKILHDYDQQNFPAERINFLKAWINLPQSKTVAYVKNNVLEGYGVLRPTQDNYKIGPLYADSNQLASQILNSLICEIPETTKIFIDSPKGNQNVLQLVNQFKMREGVSFVRMFLTEQPQVYRKKSIYGITSAQFG